MSARPVPAVRPFHATHRCHSVFSCFSPPGEFHDLLVASEKVATLLPLEVVRTSGSLPRFPISVTLLTLRLTLPPGEICCARHQVYAGPAQDRTPLIAHIILAPHDGVSAHPRPDCGNTFACGRSPRNHAMHKAFAR